MMKIETFFRVALAFPLAVPILLLLLGNQAIASVLWLSFWFGGMPYLLLAVPTFYWLRKPRARARVLFLVWISPAVFTAVMILGWLTYSLYGHFTNPDLIFDAASLLPVTFFSLLLSTGYVLVARVLLVVLERAGCLKTS